MADQPFKHLSCPAIVLRLEMAQFLGDALADAVRDELLAARRQAGARHVVVDFAAVNLVSSASFRPLLSLLREVRGHGGRLVLCNLQPDVHEVFSVTRLINSNGAAPAAFEVQPDAAAALQSLSQVR